MRDKKFNSDGSLNTSYFGRNWKLDPRKKPRFMQRPGPIVIGDSVTIKNEYINIELDDSIIGQVFSVKALRNKIALIYHETGVRLNIPTKYLKKWN